MSDLYRVVTDDADLPDNGLLAVEMRNPNEKPRIRLVPVAIDYEAAAISWIGPKDAYDNESEIQANYDVLVASVIEQTVKPLLNAAIGGSDEK